MEMHLTPSAPVAGSTAPWGVGSGEWFTPSKRGIVGPFKSASSTPTERPARASARERWAVS